MTMKILHIATSNDKGSEPFQIARRMAIKDGAEMHDTCGNVYVVQGEELSGPLDWVKYATESGVGHDIGWFDEIWIHGMWDRQLLKWCKEAIGARKKLVRVLHGGLDPARLKCVNRYKKWMLGHSERNILRKTDRVIAAGEWEEDWCRQWGYQGAIELFDFKQLFNLSPKQAT